MKKLWILELRTSARLSMVGSSLLGGCTADSTEQEETEISQIKKHATVQATLPRFSVQHICYDESL
jgi:hypothetical protein